jgi:cytochrome c oxidase subunit 5b
LNLRRKKQRKKENQKAKNKKMASLIRPMQRSLFQLKKLAAIRCKSDASVSGAPVDKSPNLEKRELIPGEDPKKACM